MYKNIKYSTHFVNKFSTKINIVTPEFYNGPNFKILYNRKKSFIKQPKFFNKTENIFLYIYAQRKNHQNFILQHNLRYNFNSFQKFTATFRSQCGHYKLYIITLNLK